MKQIDSLLEQVGELNEVLEKTIERVKEREKLLDNYIAELQKRMGGVNNPE